MLESWLGKIDSMKDSIRSFKDGIPRKLALWGSKDGFSYVKHGGFECKHLEG